MLATMTPYRLALLLVYCAYYTPDLDKSEFLTQRHTEAKEAKGRKSKTLLRPFPPTLSFPYNGVHDPLNDKTCLIFI